MNRRGVPPILLKDLRDHADDERVTRVWARIEEDLSLTEPARPRPVVRQWAVAGVLLSAAFACGVVAGKQWDPSPSAQAQPGIVHSSDEQPALDVLAAGTQGRSFGLPGGGRVTLSPGATMEMIRNPDHSISLRLVQGEASVDAIGTSNDQALAIVAGEALLSIQGGSALRVRRNPDAMDVAVSDGAVHIVAPSGARSLRRGEHAEAIPIRTIPVPPVAVALHQGPVSVALERAQVETGKPPAGSEWLGHPDAADDTQQSARGYANGVDSAIAAARSGQELMEIHDAMLSAGDATAAMRALSRIVDAFPGDEYAQMAAYKLGKMYQASGQVDLARLYFERARTLKGALAEDALCSQLKSAATREEAASRAKDYLSWYPNGRCKEDAERLAEGRPDPTEDEESAPDSGADAPIN